MTTAASAARPRWDLGRQAALSIRGGEAAVRSAVLNDLAREVLDEGGTVAVIDATATRDRPAGHVQPATTGHGALSTILDALDRADVDGGPRHLVAIDRIERLVRGGGSVENELDTALALLISACERSNVRAAVTIGSDLTKAAPQTAFALRRASKIVV